MQIPRAKLFHYGTIRKAEILEALFFFEAMIESRYIEGTSEMIACLATEPQRTDILTK